MPASSNLAMDAADAAAPMVELVPSALQWPPRTRSGPRAMRKRQRTSYPSTTARSNSSPELPSRSAMPSAAGTTEHPGWALVNGSKSSVSSAWPNIPLASAAFTAEVLTSVASTDDSGTPPRRRAYLVAISPGTRRAPETKAGQGIQDAVLPGLGNLRW